MATCAFGLFVGLIALFSMMVMEIGMDTELPEPSETSH